MRISDWSSDVCSSDLGAVLLVAGDLHAGVGGRFALAEAERAVRGDAAECLGPVMAAAAAGALRRAAVDDQAILAMRSEEHTSELQSLMRISYAVFCLKKKK